MSVLIGLGNLWLVAYLVKKHDYIKIHPKFILNSWYNDATGKLVK